MMLCEKRWYTYRSTQRKKIHKALLRKLATDRWSASKKRVLFRNNSACKCGTDKTKRLLACTLPCETWFFNVAHTTKTFTAFLAEVHCVASVNQRIHTAVRHSHHEKSILEPIWKLLCAIPVEHVPRKRKENKWLRNQKNISRQIKKNKKQLLIERNFNFRVLELLKFLTSGDLKWNVRKDDKISF